MYDPPSTDRPIRPTDLFHQVRNVGEGYGEGRGKDAREPLRHRVDPHALRDGQGRDRQRGAHHREKEPRAAPDHVAELAEEGAGLVVVVRMEVSVCGGVVGARVGFLPFLSSLTMKARMPLTVSTMPSTWYV